MADGDTTEAPARAPWTLAKAYSGAVPFTQTFAGNPYMYNNGFDQAADLFKISGILPGAPGNPMLNNRTARYDFKRTGDVPGIGQAPYLAPWAQSPLGTDNHNSGPSYIPAVNPVLWGGTPQPGLPPATPNPAPWTPPITNTNPSGAGGPIGGSPIKGGEVPGIVKGGAPASGGLLNTTATPTGTPGNFGAGSWVTDPAQLDYFKNPANSPTGAGNIPAYLQNIPGMAQSLAQNPSVMGHQQQVANPWATFNALPDNATKFQWYNAHPQYRNVIRGNMGESFAPWLQTADSNYAASPYTSGLLSSLGGK